MVEQRIRRTPQADLLRAKTLPDLSSSEDEDQYNRVDGDEGWRQDVDSLEETLGNLGLEERVARRRELGERREGGRERGTRLESRGDTSIGALPGGTSDDNGDVNTCMYIFL